MSVEKYLENIKIPDESPGPFSVRLKYNLKNTYYEKIRRRDMMLKFTSHAGILMFVALSVMIYKPTLAASLHDNLLCRTGLITSTDEDDQLIADRRQAEIELPENGHYLGMRYNVSTSATGNLPYQIMELSDLPEERPYIIRKVRDRNNRIIYIVNELDAVQSSRSSLY